MIVLWVGYYVQIWANVLKMWHVGDVIYMKVFCTLYWFVFTGQSSEIWPISKTKVSSVKFSICNGRNLYFLEPSHYSLLSISSLNPTCFTYNTCYLLQATSEKDTVKVTPLANQSSILVTYISPVDEEEEEAPAFITVQINITLTSPKLRPQIAGKHVHWNRHRVDIDCDGYNSTISLWTRSLWFLVADSGFDSFCKIVMLTHV